MMRTFLLGIAALVLAPHTSFAQQTIVAPTVTWSVFSFQTDPLHEPLWAFGEHESLPAERQNTFGTTSLTVVLREMLSPKVTVLAFGVTMDKLRFGIAAPIAVTAPALPQSYQTLPFTPGNTMGFIRPGTYDGLEQFVYGIKLNVGSPNDAALGFSWSVQYAPGSFAQNNNLPIGLAVRYRLSF